jgi:hypothetical protein
VPGAGLPRRALSARALAAALAFGLVAALALPGAAVAKPSYRKVPASTGVLFTLHGSGGYKIDVVGSGGEIFAQASKALGRRDKTAVDYNLNGPQAVDGSRVHIRLPGVAHFDAHFVTSKASHKSAESAECKPTVTTVEHGYLVGSLVFRGERGFTTTHAAKVAATIDRVPSRECRKPSIPRHVQRPSEPEAGEEFEPGLRTVEVIAGEKRSALSLVADRVESTEGEPANTESLLIVNAASKSHGMRIAHILIDFSLRASSITVSAPGAPKEATLTPPAPFSGSATFQLKAPTKARWSGDLAVELPGLGRVPLTGPRFYAGLCENSKCTRTLPGNFSGSGGLGGKLFGTTSPR